MRDGKLSAIVANSSNANCFTGKEGMDDSCPDGREGVSCFG